MQLEWLMAHLVDPPPVPDDWIDLIVTGGKEVRIYCEYVRLSPSPFSSVPSLPNTRYTDVRRD